MPILNIKSNESNSAYSVSALPKPYFPVGLARFSGIIDKDYSVELRNDVPLNANIISLALRALQYRHIIKSAKQDPSSLKFFIDITGSDAYEHNDRAALADIMTLINRPIDMIVKTFASDLALSALLSATGKRYMYSGARLMLGPIVDGAHYQQNDEHQIMGDYYNEFLRDMEYLLISRAGASDRKTAYQDMMNNKTYNALQALYYGKKGLVDAVIVGYDRVVTREDLDNYFKNNKRLFNNEQKKENFLKNYLNIDKIPIRDLKTFSAQSIPNPAPSSPIPDVKRYIDPLKHGAESAVEEHYVEKNHDSKPSKHNNGKSQSNPKTQITPEEIEHAANRIYNGLLFIDINEQDGDLTAMTPNNLSLNLKLSKDDIYSGRMMIAGLKNNANILEDDVIFYSDEFNPYMSEQVADALMALDEKKLSQKQSNHIKVIVNSPGGEVFAANELQSTIRNCNPKTKVDMIVTGQAASCGALLLSSVSGNRFITPQARVMIHKASTSLPHLPNNLQNEQRLDLNQMSADFINIISKASERPVKEVEKDIKVNYFMNPLEALFYGKKGLVDAILVGENRIITRQDVNKYLVELLGSQEKVDRYIDKHFKNMRNADMKFKPEDHDEKDPFNNSLKTIEAVKKLYAKSLDTNDKFKGSLPVKGEPINYYTVAPEHNPLLQLVDNITTHDSNNRSHNPFSKHDLANVRANRGKKFSF